MAAELPDDWKPDVWDTTLLDAAQALPHVGAALVLAHTALEDDLVSEVEEEEEDDDVEIDEEMLAEPSALGEPGVEMEHPFPDNALVARRLLERYAIGVGQIAGFVLAPEGARFVVEMPWPGRQPPRMRQGRASDFVISERDFPLVARERLDPPLFTGVGRAEFAAYNKLPDGKSVDIEFPWDPWGVASELAEFDALQQVERWAARPLAAP